MRTGKRFTGSSKIVGVFAHGHHPFSEFQREAKKALKNELRFGWHAELSFPVHESWTLDHELKNMKRIEKIVRAPEGSDFSFIVTCSNII